jgi:hypothetical protein
VLLSSLDVAPVHQSVAVTAGAAGYSRPDVIEGLVRTRWSPDLRCQLSGRAGIEEHPPHQSDAPRYDDDEDAPTETPRQRCEEDRHRASAVTRPLWACAATFAESSFAIIPAKR